MSSQKDSGWISRDKWIKAVSAFDTALSYGKVAFKYGWIPLIIVLASQDKESGAPAWVLISPIHSG